MMVLYCSKKVPELLKAYYQVRQFSVAESPLKIVKNAFYFTSKALFILKIFEFLL